MPFDTSVDPYADVEARARAVYSGLLTTVKSARTVFVGGIGGEAGQQPVGESRFLCQLFRDLVFVDDDRAGSSQFGREVISKAEFISRVGPTDVLINNCQSAAGFAYFERLADGINAQAYSTLEVLSAFYKAGLGMRFAGQLAVYGPAFHDHAYRNLDLYRDLRGAFADRLSVRTFDDLLRYRLSGNPAYLNRVAVGHNYGVLQHDSYMLNKQFFTLSDNEVFIDAGALTGDSTEYFIRSVRGVFKKVILFEPNLDSVAKTQERLRRLDSEFVGRNILKKCEIVAKGLFSFEGELSFATSLFDQDTTLVVGQMPQSAHIVDTGLTSAFVEKGKEFGVIKVPVTTLDQVIGDGPATFIKFEIEGSECDALNGAINTIRRNRPKMGLSIYHRPQDLEIIIKFVQDLDLGYRMALRAHNPSTPDAVVLYCWTEDA